MVRSFAFAERCVAGYERGDKDVSRQYERPGIATNLDAQTLGKAAECAFCTTALPLKEASNHGPAPAVLFWSGRRPSYAELNAA